jgi:hypothetical protein
METVAMARPAEKVILVNQVRSLEDGQNGEKRFSLYESPKHFGIAVVQKGDKKKLELIKALEGKEVVVYDREITTTNDKGEEVTVNQYYYLTDEDADKYADREASRDIATRVAVAKNRMLAQSAKGLQQKAITSPASLVD